jgi:TDG/mug DNA glycosylase family protein
MTACGDPDSVARVPSHRVRELWMGVEVETLEDLLAEKLRAVCVGINPSPVSVAAGHYYQGRAGQRFFARLRDAGVIPRVADGYEDDAALRAGIGFTDIVKRPTPSAKDVRPEEYAHGRELLEAKLNRFRPDLVIFTFKKTAETLFGKFAGNGFMPNLRLAHSEVFIMPGPYESRTTAQSTLQRLAERLAQTC